MHLHTIREASFRLVCWQQAVWSLSPQLIQVFLKADVDTDYFDIRLTQGSPTWRPGGLSESPEGHVVKIALIELSS